MDATMIAGKTAGQEKAAKIAKAKAIAAKQAAASKAKVITLNTVLPGPHGPEKATFTGNAKEVKAGVEKTKALAAKDPSQVIVNGARLDTPVGKAKLFAIDLQVNQGVDKVTAEKAAAKQFGLGEDFKFSDIGYRGVQPSTVG